MMLIYLCFFLMYVEAHLRESIVVGVVNKLKNSYCDGVILRSDRVMTTCSCVIVPGGPEEKVVQASPTNEVVVMSMEGKHHVSDITLHPNCVEKYQNIFLYDYAELGLVERIDVFGQVRVARIPIYESVDEYEMKMYQVVGDCFLIRSIVEVAQYTKMNVTPQSEGCFGYLTSACSFMPETDKEFYECSEELSEYKRKSVFCFETNGEVSRGSPVVCKSGLVWAIVVHQDIQSPRLNYVTAFKLFRAQLTMSYQPTSKPFIYILFINFLFIILK